MKGYVLFTSIIAALAWRLQHIIYPLMPADLPVEYFATGSGPKDASTHCHVLHSPDNRLAFCEDATFWDFQDAEGNLVDRKVVAGCDPNRRAWNTVMGPLKDPNPRAALWLVDFNGEKESIHELKFEDYPTDKDFHPLGIQIWPSKAESTSNMFIVNHGRHNTTIEQFVLDPKNTATAKYVRTMISPYFVSPNALALTSPSSFFITNDHLLTRRLPSFLGKILPLFETYSGLPLAFVSHVSIVNDDATGDAVMRHTLPILGIAHPNGIALSPDGRTVAVASSSFSRVQFFNRTQNADGTESLKFLYAVSVPFAPDNLHYDDDGSLSVAGHPYYPALVAFAANETKPNAPSWVVSLTPRKEGESESDETGVDANAPFSAARRVNPVPSHKIETVYQGDGSKFGGSTTGLRDSRTGILFVSGLYQDGLLVCRP